MNQKQTAAPPLPGLGLGDIYYIVFRRKWLILGGILCGLAAAEIAYVRWPTTYSSTAKLYIAYIAETKSPDEETPNVKVTPTTTSGNPLTSEVEILTSLDNLRAAAETLTPARIMAKYGGETNANLDQAAAVIQMNLSVASPPHSQIIWVTFSSRSQEIVQPVLEQVITNYINKHLVIHQPVNDDWVTRENSMREQDLKATENQLADLKSKAGIVNLKEEESAYKAQEGSIRQENYLALADLADATARLEQLRKLLPVTNQIATTNGAAPSLPQPSERTVNEYKQARQELADLQAREANYEIQYSTNVLKVQANLNEIRTTQARLRTLEEANPGLLAMAKEEARTPGAPAALDPMAAYNSEVIRIAGLMAKINEFAKEIQQFEDRGTNLNRLEVMIEDLERVRAMQEDYLKRVSGQMYAAKIEGTIGDYRGSNIKLIQSPSPPASDTKKCNKVILTIAAGGVLLGFGVAFLWELVLDRSLKRPKEVAARLKCPLFLNIPYLNGNGHGWMGLLKPGRKVKLLSSSAGDAMPAGPGGGVLAPPQNGGVARWEENQALGPFYETLRDRLIAYFEMINLTHKPKLVALTSCHNGAGVSTTASGLARLLSETGEGNVLLVNMNSESGDAHHFHKGSLSVGLEDIFEKAKETRENALVQKNLYMVNESTNRDKLPAMLPKRFSHLVSKMKASDYDYIIFDMPPVTQISVTPRLARFMDMVLLVVESEKTDRDAAERAGALLSECKANMGVVMNKSRSYVPQRLHQEL
jgi:uncharacterized protein involved in exopolysaccharide biosynthesis/Mrp family chromosome partitioning ATPase